MKWRVVIFVCALMLCLGRSTAAQAQEQPAVLPEAPRPQPGIIVGTVLDVNSDAVPGATVVLQGPGVNGPRTVVSNNNGFFQFSDIESGNPGKSTSAPPALTAGLRPDAT